MLNGLKYVYVNQNRFSERIGASWRRETSFGGLGGQKRVAMCTRGGVGGRRFTAYPFSGLSRLAMAPAAGNTIV